MFNKKLKERITSLENELGYAYSNEYHSNLEDGELRRAECNINALVEYLDLKNDSGRYGSVKFVKKDAK